MTQDFAVDASAIVAILNREPDHPRFLAALSGGAAVVGWATLFEIRIWCLRRLDSISSPWLEQWLDDGAVEAIPFDRELESLAAEAYRRFGKGRHAAALNFGDCMAYAVAARHRVPLLFKGSDFARTDLAVHPASVGA